MISRSRRAWCTSSRPILTARRVLHVGKCFSRHRLRAVASHVRVIWKRASGAAVVDLRRRVANKLRATPALQLITDQWLRLLLLLLLLLPLHCIYPRRHLYHPPTSRIDKPTVGRSPVAFTTAWLTTFICRQTDRQTTNSITLIQPKLNIYCHGRFAFTSEAFTRTDFFFIIGSLNQWSWTLKRLLFAVHV